ncbi:cysteine hydrolase family protein [Persicobacter diffluens]|uniref:Isochorismatase family protein YrdC n=1 Tax=Persicobacter diffluens TaxID=981 RepID=A0AAN4W1I9_9BACT|nr:putative isochorismatase family protein YrdC [Persicobacter diffluens]
MKPTALLLIDIQKGFENTAYWGGGRNNPEAEKKAALLLEHWRKMGWPLFHIKHCSTTPGSPLEPHQSGNEIQACVFPIEKEPVLEKKVNSGFIGTGLMEKLNDLGVSEIIIAGLTTDHCISTTARMGANLGFKVKLVEDACATFDKTGPKGEKYSAQLIHDTAIASLHQEFAEICSVEDILSGD